MNLQEQIRKICAQICNDELTQLRLEEELLITFVKSQKLGLAKKAAAFERMNAINRRQIEILGGN